MQIFAGIVEQGLIYGLLALGIYISFIILNMPDLTVDGSFPFGCALSAACVLAGLPPQLALLIAFLGGLACGAITGLIHVKLHVQDFFAGMITSTALYSANLYVAGQANVALFDSSSLFNSGLLAKLFTDSLQPWRSVLIIFPLVLLVQILLEAFLKTKAGFLLKASGDSPSLVRTLAKDPGHVKIFGLALANGLVALSGALLCQQQRFFDISIGTGSMMMGLASVVIGLRLFQRLPKLADSVKVLLGSILYKAIFALAISLGLPANAMKLATALFFLVILVLSMDPKGGHDA